MYIGRRWQYCGIIISFNDDDCKMFHWKVIGFDLIKRILLKCLI